MRLVRSTLYAYCLPYWHAVRWSDVVEEGASFLMLRLETQEGHVGVSEMTTKPTWTGFGLRSLAESVSEVLLPRLLGVDLSDEEQVTRQMSFIPGQHAAKALVDNALWDLRAAAAGVPLWEQWNGRRDVPVSFTVTRSTPVAMAREAAQVVGDYGFSVLKIKGGQDLETDAQVLQALRSAVGDDVTFYVDANAAYQPQQALEYARGMVAAGARVIEDPCQLHPGTAFQELQAGLERPLLVDFNCWSVEDMRQFRQAGAKAFSLKPGRLGLTATLVMLDDSRAHNDLTVVGMFGESALGTWQALALASCVEEPSLPAEATWFMSMREQVLADVPQVRNGHIGQPHSASVAERVDWAKVRHFSVAPPQDKKHQ